MNLTGFDKFLLFIGISYTADKKIEQLRREKWQMIKQCNAMLTRCEMLKTK